MAKMTKKKLIELIRESVEEHMSVTEACPDMSMDDVHAEDPMGVPMEPMDNMEDSKMDQLLDMMQQVLMKLDGGSSMQAPMVDPEPVEIEMRESKSKKTKRTKK